MKDLRINRRQVLKGVGAIGVVGALSGPAAVFADDDGEGRRVRWDILTPVTTTLTPGGHLSALTSDGSMITMTGSGTFGPEGSADVTGGGTWMTSDATGASTGSGTYRVTRLVSFTREPQGTLVGSGLTDTIGNLADVSAGLAVLRIAYSNGSKGVLVVSCTLPGSPPSPSILEGITATMGFVDYWKSVEAAQTLFHIRRQD